ncbi:unnamed protein product, partial [Rotaria sp. Silwood1]
KLQEWLLNLGWTPQAVTQWQEFYNKAQRFILYDREGQFTNKVLLTIPKYKDLTA